MEKYEKEKIIGNLFNNYFHSLVFKSFGIVNDYDSAKDIVQDVFVKIWQLYDQIEHIKDLKPYIFKAVQNSSFNYIRDQKVQNSIKVPVDQLNIADQEEGEEMDNKEAILNKIHTAIDTLPENWRTAFILSKYDKLKYNEIAIKMNISVKTVEKYISKALEIIRLDLKSHIFIFFLIHFFS